MNIFAKFLKLPKNIYFFIVISFSMLLAAGPAQAVNNVISNPDPSVFNKIQQVGFFDTRGLNLNTANLARVNRLAAVLDGYAYISEGNNTCGGTDALGAIGPLGALIVDVHNPANPILVGYIPDQIGLNSFNLGAFKLANGHNILVIMTGNGCAAPFPSLPQHVAEGMDIYNIDNPASPIFLTHVAIPEINSALRAQYASSDPSLNHLGVSFIRNVIQKDGKSYAMLNVGADGFTPSLGNAQIWDFTNPSAPVRVSYWGSEMIQVAALGLPISLMDIPNTVNPDLQSLTDYLLGINPLLLANNFGAQNTRLVGTPPLMMQNGQRAFVPMNEAGLALLDTKDLANPKLISIALNTTPEIFDLSKSISSSAVAATANGKTVVELDRDGSPSFLSVNLNGGPPLIPVAEGSLTKPIASLPGKNFSGNTVYVGLACAAVIPPPSGVTVAVALRGTCSFATKMEFIRQAGYIGFVMINTGSASSEAIGMAGTPIAGQLPGIGTSLPTGLSIFGGTTIPAIGTLGPNLSASALQTNYGYVRIWDFSNEKNPVLASTFRTLCSSDASLVGTAACPKVGPTGGGFAPLTVTIQGQKAFVAWAQDGLVVIDIKDPYHPREIARFTTNQSTPGLSRFAEAYLVNTGSNNEDNLLYITDESNGLYILKMGN